jgi:hypothetical protein
MLPNQILSLPLTPFAPQPTEAAASAVAFEYDAAMVATRVRILHSLNDSKMPTNLKQRYIEQEILRESVDLAVSCAAMRREIVEALLENVDKGPGHLSIHRAKRALKEISARLGLKFVSELLQAQNYSDRCQAAHLLGWSKSTRATKALLLAHRTADSQTRQVILLVLKRHYAALYAFSFPGEEMTSFASDFSPAPEQFHSQSERSRIPEITG